MPKASVVLLSSHGKHLIATRSDKAGVFHLSAVHSANTILEIHHPGFKPFVLHRPEITAEIKPATAVLHIADYALLQRNEIVFSADLQEFARNQDGSVYILGIRRWTMTA